MKVKLMDSKAWIDTKKIIAFDEDETVEPDFKTKKLKKNIEYQVIVPGKILVVSKANYFSLLNIWSSEQ